MGYFARRLVGYIVFLSVLGLLSTIAVDANQASGGTFLMGTNGAVIGVLILAAAFLSSLTVRLMMRRRSRLRRPYLP